MDDLLNSKLDPLVKELKTLQIEVQHLNQRVARLESGHHHSSMEISPQASMKRPKPDTTIDLSHEMSSRSIINYESDATNHERMARERAEQEARIQAIRERNEKEELERQRRYAAAEKANEEFRQRERLAQEAFQAELQRKQKEHEEFMRRWQ